MAPSQTLLSLGAMLQIWASFPLAMITCSSAFHMPSPSILRNNNDVSPTKSSMFTTISAQPSSHAALSRSSKMIPSLCIMMSSNDDRNMPSQEEIAQNKQAAYNALASFHETSSSLTSSTQIKSLLAGLDDGGEEEQVKPEYWSCSNGAITYKVPMDPAAGLKRGVISKPYKCSVQVEMDLGELRGGVKRRGLRLVESIQFGKENDEATSLSIPFVRSIPLGANVDVDAVDGSYSLDDTIIPSSAEASLLPLLPPSLLVGVDPTAVQFLVEHTLAVSETERCRCFLLYGDDGGKNEEEEYDAEEKSQSDEKTDRNYRLLGVVLAEETKVMPEQQQTTDEKASSDDDDDESDYAAEFISQMIESPSPSESPSSPLDLLAINQPEDSEDDKMSRLMQSLDKHNERVMDSAAGGGGGSDGPNDNTQMERHSLGMFGLTSGVFLGDTFVREILPSTGQLSRIRQSRQKGFGKTSQMTSNKIGDDESEEDRFATWQMGVQKVALQFNWDYYESISQSYTYGKFMGAATSLSSMANIKSDGIVVVNEARPTKKREEKRVIWDMDGGAYVGGLIDGSSYFRAPRYMSFSQSRSYSADAYLTEFMVFYRPGKDDDASQPSNIIDAEIIEGAVPEYYCSRTSRLYNANDGSLMQGSTAFFSMKQPLVDSAEQ